MCPRSPKPEVNRPAYAPTDISSQIAVQESTPSGAKVGSPSKGANDATVTKQAGGIQTRR